MSAPSTQPVQTSHSARFYHEIVTFEIEGTLYRVLKHGFVKYSQTFFRDLFDVPQGPGREGDSDENPIRAPQVTSTEFDSLLEVVYPLALTAWPPNLSKDQWTGVLRLSRQWDMPDVASLAIKQLDGLDLTSIEKVSLGRVHGVPHWLKDGYTALVSDVNAVSLDDLETLGLRTANRVLYAQNQTHILGEKNDLYCGYCVQRGNGAWLLQYQETGQLTGTYRCNSYCGNDPETSGCGAYSVVNFSSSKPSTNSSVADKVAEVFKDEIDEAERRNILPSA